METENLTAVNTLIDTKRQEIAETKKLIEQQEANLAYLAVKRVSLWVKLGLIAKKVLKLKGKITGKKKTLNGLTDGKDGLDKRLSALENQFNAVLTGVKPVVVATDATEETPKAENNLTNETPEA